MRGGFVDAVDYNVDVAVVVEIAKGGAPPRHFFENAGTGVQRDIRKPAVPQIAVQHFAFAITRFRIGLANLGIDVAVADEDVGPTVVVEADVSYAAATEASLLSQP